MYSSQLHDTLYTELRFGSQIFPLLFHTSLPLLGWEAQSGGRGILREEGTSATAATVSPLATEDRGGQNHTCVCKCREEGGGCFAFWMEEQTLRPLYFILRRCGFL